jgi:hypothetical protein
MATTDARAAHRDVHVHGGEVSTDGASLWGYAEAILLLIAIVAFASAVWLAAMPNENADFVQPAPAAPPGGYVIVTPDGTIQQPDVDGPQEVAVVVPGGADAGMFGDPFGTGLGSSTA